MTKEQEENEKDILIILKRICFEFKTEFDKKKKNKVIFPADVKQIYGLFS